MEKITLAQTASKLCGMLNSDSAQGTIALGIVPDGEVVGVDPGNLDKAQRSLLQFIQDNCEPPIQCTMEVCKDGEKRILTVSAERNRSVPYHEFRGRAFIPEGTTTRQLSISKKQSFERQRNRDLHRPLWFVHRRSFADRLDERRNIYLQVWRRVASILSEARCVPTKWTA
jgi:predicted HTH transcriptional regulator